MKQNKLMENYFDNYDEWGQKILRQCQEQVPEVEWYIKQFSPVLFLDWGDGPPMFYIRTCFGDYCKDIDLSAQFLDDIWDEAIEMAISAGRRLAQAVKEKGL